MVLPSCQDTGTAIVIGKKGQNVFTDGSDEEALSRGIYKTYTETSLQIRVVNFPAFLVIDDKGNDFFSFV